MPGVWKMLKVSALQHSKLTCHWHLSTQNLWKFELVCCENPREPQTPASLSVKLSSTNESAKKFNFLRLRLNLISQSIKLGFRSAGYFRRRVRSTEQRLHARQARTAERSRAEGVPGNSRRLSRFALNCVHLTNLTLMQTQRVINFNWLYLLIF